MQRLQNKLRLLINNYKNLIQKLGRIVHIKHEPVHVFLCRYKIFLWSLFFISPCPVLLLCWTFWYFFCHVSTTYMSPEVLVPFTKPFFSCLLCFCHLWLTSIPAARNSPIPFCWAFLSPPLSMMLQSQFPPTSLCCTVPCCWGAGLTWDPILGLVPSLTAFSLNPASLMKTVKLLPPFCLSHFCNVFFSMKKLTIKNLIPFPKPPAAAYFQSEVLLSPSCWWCNSLPCTLTLLTLFMASTNTKLHVTTNILLLVLS